MTARLGMAVVFACLLGAIAAVAMAENINPKSDGSRYAFGENIGWINAEPSGNGGPGVTVSDVSLTGYLYGENIGWINLNCTNNGTCASTGNYGVSNDGAGHLSGYAWAENAGWISFSCQNNPPSCASTGSYGVTIDVNTGTFHGHAWGENIGWISFGDGSPFAYKVTTLWSNDADADGCTALEESGSNHTLGGQRNPDDFWDYFDVTGDRRVDLSDTLVVLAHFGHGPSDDVVDPLLDRYAPNAAEPWRSAKSITSEGVDLSDALASLASFGDDCDSPP